MLQKQKGAKIKFRTYPDFKNPSKFSYVRIILNKFTPFQKNNAIFVSYAKMSTYIC